MHKDDIQFTLQPMMTELENRVQDGFWSLDGFDVDYSSLKRLAEQQTYVILNLRAEMAAMEQALTEETSNLAEQLEDSEDEVSSLNNQVESLERGLNGLQEDLDDTQTKIRDLEEQVSDLESERDQLSSDCDELGSIISGLRQEVKDLESQL